MQENNRPGPIILDVETTGLSLSDQVIQVCLCDHKDRRLMFHSFAMPTVPIHPNATRRNGIDWQLLEQANARPWPKVWRDLADFLGAGGVVYSYCWPFDKRMIKQTCEAHGIDCSMTAHGIMILNGTISPVKMKANLSVSNSENRPDVKKEVSSPI